MDKNLEPAMGEAPNFNFQKWTEIRGRYNKTTKYQILNPTRLRGTAIAKSRQLIAKKFSVYPCLFPEAPNNNE